MPRSTLCKLGIAFALLEYLQFAAGTQVFGHALQGHCHAGQCYLPTDTGLMEVAWQFYVYAKLQAAAFIVSFPIGLYCASRLAATVWFERAKMEGA